MAGRRLWLAAFVALIPSFATGCATQTRMLGTVAPQLPVRTELVDTPFFAQQQHQCGPAALATGLVAAGYPADPEQLAHQVFLPGREGSLQVEMLAGARRNGALTLPAPANLAGLFAEVAAGRPVIILQNLGLAVAPRWHYAVVIGYDREKAEVFLRSGPNRREVMAMSTFERTWARSAFWGMMILPPGRLPLSADQPALEKSLTRLEKFATPAAMHGWYAQAARRWPDSLVFMIGLGNAALANGNPEEAEQAYRQAAERHPRNSVALNNLATLLLQRGRLDEALAVAESAVALADEWRPQAEATRDAIRLAISGTGARPAAPAP